MFELMILLFLLFFSSLHALTVTPVCVIEGKQALLDRPEGIAFSPSGDLLVVANSDGGSVTVYPRRSEGQYENVPSVVLSDPARLVYPHDLTFTSSGKFLGVACRDNKSVHIFKRQGEGFELFSSIQGSSSLLNLPAGLSFSPSEEVLGVSNRVGYSLTFYRQQNEGRYELQPFFQIGEDLCRAYNLSSPHALDMAPDGQTIAVAHKKYCDHHLPFSAFAIWDLEKKIPIYIYPMGKECIHSISFHPSGNYLVTTNERKDVEIFEKMADNTFQLAASIPVDKQGQREGAKGAVFSPCGQYLAFTTMAPRVLIYKIDY